MKAEAPRRTPDSPAQPVPSDEACDVLVLGAGGVAAAAGLGVVLAERTALVGGTMAVSGGMVRIPANRKMAAVGIPDSPAAARLYLSHFAPDGPATVAREAFLRHADAAIADLEAATDLRLCAVHPYPDYHPGLPGATLGGRVPEPAPFDARALGADFALLRPPLPEFMLLGGLMVARPDLVHFRNARRSRPSARRVAALVAAYAWQRLSHPRGTTLVALLTVAVVEPGALGALRMLSRGLFAGRRRFARRVHAMQGAAPSVARPSRGVFARLPALVCLTGPLRAGRPSARHERHHRRAACARGSLFNRRREKLGCRLPTSGRSTLGSAFLRQFSASAQRDAGEREIVRKPARDDLA